ncbi:limonene-1,2-epoxide hydrolase family protein [Novosphingobium bradum]|uniref:Limonene-1,2-epoxide hydrolase family protein n=1 Tax=Novosphingobium bradum TaxID=1737444 RepID=A0ABV7ISJ1_9SPHN
MGNSERVLAYIRAWEEKSVEDILARMTPDAVWQNTGLPDAIGHDAIRAVAAAFLGDAEVVEFTVHAIAETADGKVFTERTDRFEGPRGNFVIPVNGVFEFSGDLICAWRDYFDPGPFKAG